jgi:hypothetical protein
MQSSPLAIVSEVGEWIQDPGESELRLQQMQQQRLRRVPETFVGPVSVVFLLVTVSTVFLRFTLKAIRSATLTGALLPPLAALHLCQILAVGRGITMEDIVTVMCSVELTVPLQYYMFWMDMPEAPYTDAVVNVIVERLDMPGKDLRQMVMIPLDWAVARRSKSASTAAQQVIGNCGKPAVEADVFAFCTSHDTPRVVIFALASSLVSGIKRFVTHATGWASLHKWMTAAVGTSSSFSLGPVVSALDKARCLGNTRVYVQNQRITYVVKIYPMFLEPGDPAGKNDCLKSIWMAQMKVVAASPMGYVMSHAPPRDRPWGNTKQCAAQGCEHVRELNMCGRCKRVYYCSRRCQKKHWKAAHKLTCKPI